MSDDTPSKAQIAIAPFLRLINATPTPICINYPRPCDGNCSACEKRGILIAAVRAIPNILHLLEKAYQ